MGQIEFWGPMVYQRIAYMKGIRCGWKRSVWKRTELLALKLRGIWFSGKKNTKVYEWRKETKRKKDERKKGREEKGTEW